MKKINMFMPRNYKSILLVFFIFFSSIETRFVFAELPAGTRGWEFIPTVIRNDGIDTFRLYIDTNGPVNKVTIGGILPYFTPVGILLLELRDDGLDGDQIAGDYIFTSQPFVYNTSVDFNVIALTQLRRSKHKII